jgi:FMN-dependent NADH-azoreductase
VAEAYLAAQTTANPGIKVDTLSVWDIDLPVFDGNKVAAKINAMIGISADRYLFSVPMWNSGIPYRLKHYIDVIHQPGLLWGLTPETGYFGLLKNKHATLVLTSGAYSESAPKPAFGLDLHATYMHAWLNQAGITAIDEIRFQPTLLTQDPSGDFERAKRAAFDLAGKHGRV